MKGKYLKTVLALTSVLFCCGVNANKPTTTTTSLTPTQTAPVQPTSATTVQMTTAMTADTTTTTQTPQAMITGLIQEAISFVKEHGEEEAFKVFNNPEGPFAKGTTYVFAIDFKGNILAHGSDADLIGKNQYDFKDSKGRSVVRALIEKGRYGEGAWVNYFWKNPTTQTEECKTSYVTTVDKKYIIGAGYFHPLNAKGQCTEN